MRRRCKQSSSLPDEEQNHLLTGGSNTPQHDRTHTQSAQLSSSDEKDVNSNLLHGTRSEECTAVERPDPMFDEDSLAAAFSTPEVQRRCSELAQMTFHHFRHSPQPPPADEPMPPGSLFSTYPLKGIHPRPAPIQIVYSSGEEISDLAVGSTINGATGGVSAATTATCSPRETFLPTTSFSPILFPGSATVPTFPDTTLTGSPPNLLPFATSGSHTWTHLPHRIPNLLVQQDTNTGQTITSIAREPNRL